MCECTILNSDDIVLSLYLRILVQYYPSFNAQKNWNRHIPFDHDQQMSGQSDIVSVEFEFLQHI